MSPKVFVQRPTLSANGFVQEESAIKVLVEIIVHKFRKRNKQNLPVILPVKMSDLQEEVLSLSTSTNNIQMTPSKNRTISNSDFTDNLSVSRIKEDIEDSIYNIVSITSDEEEAVKLQDVSYGSICEVKSLSFDTETDRCNNIAAMNISSINGDQNHNTSFSSSIFADSEEVDNSIYGNYINMINVQEDNQENDITTDQILEEDSGSRKEDPAVSTDNSNQTDDRITKIIHELVLQKYEHALKSFRSRSLKRRKRFSEGDLAEFWKKDDEDDEGSDSEESIDSGLNFSTEDLPQKTYENTESAKKVEVDALPREEIVVTDLDKSLGACAYLQHDLSIKGLVKEQAQPKILRQLSLQRPSAPLAYSGETVQNTKPPQVSDLQKLSSKPMRRNEEVEYDERKFLTAALGKELLDTTDESYTLSQASSINKLQTTPSSYRNSSGGSIGSSRISTLITSSDKSEGVDSLYSTVDKNRKMYTRKDLNSVAKPLFSAVKEDSDLDCYESVFEIKHSIFEEELITQNSLQREIIHQASKALQICRADPDYFGEDVLLEAEKILLIATCKKDVLSKQITKVEYEDISDCVNATIALKNIKFRLDYDAFSRSCDKGTWHFICIVDAGNTVLSSPLTKHNDNGTITFVDGFKFEELQSDIEINLRIFAICIAKHQKKSALCRTFGRKRRHRLKQAGTVQTSFVLLGKTTIRNNSIQSKSFKLSQVPLDAVITDTFTLDMDVFIRLNTSKSGFLTVGKTHKGAIIWYRRWCVLEGSRFKYWNYPLETEQEPICTLDLLNCANQIVLEADRSVCCRPRTICFEIVIDNSVQKYYLSADSKADLESWQDCLNTMLRALSKWNYTNCYLLN